jgi:type I protein arginine methyltransferase
MSLVVDAHREYLADRVRLEAFERAIAASVRPGDIVVDLGAGTGILGMMACRAGAARVYSVEAGGMIQIARALAHANGLADRMTFLLDHSDDAQVPEPADVLVGDLIGRMGFEAGVFEAYPRARRWLKPDARVIPSSIAIAAAPVEHAPAHADVESWSHATAGFRMDPALSWSRNTGYPRHVDRAQVLSDGAASRTFTTMDDRPRLRLDGTAIVSRAGTMHGLAAWFSACLAPGVTMTNAPGAAARINRRNVFLPIDPSIAVQAGDSVAIDIRIRPVDFVVSWSAEVKSPGGIARGPRARHSTLGGMLLTPEDLRSSDPASRPRLTPRGEARRTLLLLCDGGHPLEEIEREVLRRHADLFASLSEAQAFVAEVVTRYGVVD